MKIISRITQSIKRRGIICKTVVDSARCDLCAVADFLFPGCKSFK